MLIRLAAIDDLPGIVDIYNHEVIHTTATLDTEPVTVDERRQWFEDHAPERYPILVAEDDDSLLGWASLSPWSERRGYARTVESSVYIAVEHRRRGVGKALLAAILGRARELGYGVVLARISSGEGSASRTLHESAGFRLVGRMHRVGQKLGRILDIDLLEAPLEDDGRAGESG
jgi:phosphinothricin acetyltransferase